MNFLPKLVYVKLFLNFEQNNSRSRGPRNVDLTKNVDFSVKIAIDHVFTSQQCRKTRKSLPPCKFVSSNQCRVKRYVLSRNFSENMVAVKIRIFHTVYFSFPHCCAMDGHVYKNFREINVFTTFFQVRVNFAFLHTVGAATKFGLAI